MKTLTSYMIGHLIVSLDKISFKKLPDVEVLLYHMVLLFLLKLLVCVLKR